MQFLALPPKPDAELVKVQQIKYAKEPSPKCIQEFQEFVWDCSRDQKKMEMSFTLPKAYDPKQEEFSVCYAAAAQNLAACSLLEILDDNEVHDVYNVNELAWLDLKDLQEAVKELTATDNAIDTHLDRIKEQLKIKDLKDEIPSEKCKIMMEEKLDALVTFQGTMEKHLATAELELAIAKAEILFNKEASNPVFTCGTGNGSPQEEKEEEIGDAQDKKTKCHKEQIKHENEKADIEGEIDDLEKELEEKKERVETLDKYIDDSEEIVGITDKEQEMVDSFIRTDLNRLAWLIKNRVKQPKCKIIAGADGKKEKDCWASDLPKGFTGKGHDEKKYLADQKELWRSKHAQHSIHVKFENGSKKTVEVFWLDYKGDKKSYGKLGAGKSRTQQTFATHPWHATDEQGHEFYFGGDKVWVPTKDDDQKTLLITSKLANENIQKKD